MIFVDLFLAKDKESFMVFFKKSFIAHPVKNDY